jgi:hypothetical protein
MTERLYPEKFEIIIAMTAAINPARPAKGLKKVTTIISSPKYLLAEKNSIE